MYLYKYLLLNRNSRLNGYQAAIITNHPPPSALSASFTFQYKFLPKTTRHAKDTAIPSAHLQNTIYQLISNSQSQPLIELEARNAHSPLPIRPSIHPSNPCRIPCPHTPTRKSLRTMELLLRHKFGQGTPTPTLDTSGLQMERGF
ncbi:hypothetical protein BJ508DRAFT_20694 [Ascobolus immersus RN42]|uniref:Uncharacterized protein n=1 Tax=Ascobolus immersus RN42 TaxID=1160509 RepID=A0A3N4ITM1_ASCIM|nr:hypothetical protein BJ508DRAFT_20694 [Ascobolus immersus RN42]